MPNYESDPKQFTLDVHCPRCGHLVRALPQAGPICHISPHTDTDAYMIVRCPRDLCDVFFIIYDRLNRRVRRIYPFPDSSPGDLHSAIPEDIRKDFSEARRCWFADAHKGVVVMCRRVMQLLATEKGATGSRLIDQIDSLHEQGLITKSLHVAAHEIRHFGNFGAHPRDDNLDDISNDDANAILKLTYQFLVDLYIRPHETAQLTAKRKGV